MALVAFGLWLGAVAGALGSNSPLEASKVAAGLVLAFLLALDFGALALVVASYTGNRSAAIGIAAAVLVVMYFVNALAPIIESLDSIKGLSLFYWYLEGNPIRNGLAVGDSLGAGRRCARARSGLARALRATRPRCLTAGQPNRMSRRAFPA